MAKKDKSTAATKSPAKATAKKAAPKSVKTSRGAAAAGGRRPASKKTLKHVEALRAMARNEHEAYFKETAPSALADIFEKSYCADLVNVLLDLRRSTVKELFHTVAAVRKRAVTDAATLYYYKEYLTNPLPLRVTTLESEDIPNYYAVLGMPRDATDEQLKQAGRLLLRAHDAENFSPEMRGANVEQAEVIREASKCLAPAQREALDAVLPNMSYLYPRRDQSWLDSVQRLLD